MLPGLPVGVRHGELVEIREQGAHHRIRRPTDRRRQRSVRIPRHGSGRRWLGFQNRDKRENEGEE